MPPPTIWVADPSLARSLRADRLLLASLRFEPTFKHETGVDDPDEAAAELEASGAVKKARRVRAFDFDALLPLPMRVEEAWLARVEDRVRFELAGANTFRAVAPPPPHSSSPPPDPSDTLAFSTLSALAALHPARFATYRRLWLAGCSLVDGLKFGVDFLAYSGDPIRTHADLMVLVASCPDDETFLPNLELTAVSTLAAKTRKEAVIATLAAGETSPLARPSFIALKRQPVNLDTKSGRRTLEEALLDEIPALGAAPVLEPDAEAVAMPGGLDAGPEPEPEPEPESAERERDPTPSA